MRQANSFATSVASGTITHRQAIVIALFAEFFGAFVLGSSVTETIKKKVIDTSRFVHDPYVLMLAMGCTSTGSAIWVLVATYFQMPVSTTHATVGAIMGIGIASFGSTVPCRISLRVRCRSAAFSSASEGLSRPHPPQPPSARRTAPPRALHEPRAVSAAVPVTPAPDRPVAAGPAWAQDRRGAVGLQQGRLLLHHGVVVHLAGARRCGKRAVSSSSSPSSSTSSTSSSSSFSSASAASSLLSVGGCRRRPVASAGAAATAVCHHGRKPLPAAACSRVTAIAWRALATAPRRYDDAGRATKPPLPRLVPPAAGILAAVFYMSIKVEDSNDIIHRL